MYCQYCGNEISLELKFCNRCGGQIDSSAVQMTGPPTAPVKLAVPTIVLGITVVTGLGIIFGGASELAQQHMHPAAITWIILFSMATLFGCTALLLRFWSKLFLASRQTTSIPQKNRPPVAPFVPSQLPPRFEPVPSVTEHPTRTFSPAYREPSDRS
jgi:hypothetical protein